MVAFMKPHAPKLVGSSLSHTHSGTLPYFRPISSHAASWMG